MNKTQKQKGVIIETLRGGQFNVELDSGKIMRCYISGKIRKHSIRIVPGDKVMFEIPENSEIGRIVRRL